MIPPRSQRSCMHFRLPTPHTPPPYAPTYLINGSFFDQKTLEYHINWNINIRKDRFLYEKINFNEIKIQKSSINQKGNNKMSVMLCTGVTFAKKVSCLVARIVSFDTAVLYLFSFRVLEPYQSKDIKHLALMMFL